MLEAREDGRALVYVAKYVQIKHVIHMVLIIINK